jgi:hypothetical protein
MKSLSFLFFTLILPTIGFSQGNLQFNQVKLVSTIETVPVGKVWKVEAAFGDALLSNCSTQPMHRILVNNNQLTVSNVSSVGFNNYCNGWQGTVCVTTFPFWLPAGSTLAISSNVVSISVIEFNIIP